ncbi:GDP-mannose:glycolipid 4-beta-D-mannosyltransferase (plasmid) [Bryobacterales bacterium F-183]|nr:GDP-mannose:glycolipid 4-beta-D-mannosyltransferase [Bryobacterales bacterium F-183]
MSRSVRVCAVPAYANRQFNPYNALLYDHVKPHVSEVVEFRVRARARGPVDILHIHWPDLAVRSQGAWHTAALDAAKYLARIRACKARGARLVWTAHNLAPHDTGHPRLMRWYFRSFLRLVDGVIFLSEASRTEAFAQYPWLRETARTVVIPHGHYGPVLQRPGLSREAARRELGLEQDGFLFLFFGQVRAYKNVPLLLCEFLALDSGEARLAIAGLPGPAGAAGQELRAEIEGLAAGRVHLDLRLIPDDTLEAYLAACDCVVLPYRNILNSGSVLMSLSMGRPVIAPAVGSLPELAAKVGPQWVRCYTGEFQRGLLADALQQRLPEEAKPDLSPYDWPAIGEQTAAFYQSLMRS